MQIWVMITLIDQGWDQTSKITEYPENPDKNTCDIANTRETFDEINPGKK